MRKLIYLTWHGDRAKQAMRTWHKFHFYSNQSHKFHDKPSSCWLVYSWWPVKFRWTQCLRQNIMLMNSQLSTKGEQDKDRAGNKLVITIDLQNAIISSSSRLATSFCKRKLNVYNLAAHSSWKKQGHCCIWTKAQNGGTGNDIASATIWVSFGENCWR